MPTIHAEGLLNRVMSKGVDHFVQRCQLLVGRQADISLRDLASGMRHVVADVPSSIPRSDQLIVSNVLTRLLARLVELAGLDDRPHVARAFVRLAHAGPAFDQWRQEWLRAVDMCCAALSLSRPDAGPGVPDARVASMLLAIERRHADPKLDLRMVAKAVGMSPWYAARLLKRRTGSGFVAHLHRFRTVAASHLLVETSLSVKEVASKVGYNHQSQLTRQFKLSYGVVPTTFRRARAGTIHAFA